MKTTKRAWLTLALACAPILVTADNDQYKIFDDPQHNYSDEMIAEMKKMNEQLLSMKADQEKLWNTLPYEFKLRGSEVPRSRGSNTEGLDNDGWLAELPEEEDLPDDDDQEDDDAEEDDEPEEDDESEDQLEEHEMLLFDSLERHSQVKDLRDFIQAAREKGDSLKTDLDEHDMEIINEFNKHELLASVANKIASIRTSPLTHSEFADLIAVGCAVLDDIPIYVTRPASEYETEVLSLTTDEEQIKRIDVLERAWKASSCVNSHHTAYIELRRMQAVASQNVPKELIIKFLTSKMPNLEKTFEYVAMLAPFMDIDETYVYDVLDAFDNSTRVEDVDFPKVRKMLKTMADSVRDYTATLEKDANSDIAPLKKLYDEQVDHWTKLSNDKQDGLSEEERASITSGLLNDPIRNDVREFIETIQMLSEKSTTDTSRVLKDLSILLNRLQSIKEFRLGAFSVMECLWEESMTKSESLGLPKTTTLCYAFRDATKWRITAAAEQKFCYDHKNELKELLYGVESEGTYDGKFKKHLKKAVKSNDYTRAVSHFQKSCPVEAVL